MLQLALMAARVKPHLAKSKSRLSGLKQEVGGDGETTSARQIQIPTIGTETATPLGKDDKKGTCQIQIPTIGTETSIALASEKRSKPLPNPNPDYRD